MEITAIETAISNLANTMRLYVEAHMRFGELFRVDREEAIHNIDRAMEAKLEAFHRLYDVSKSRFAYFDFADCSLLIALRNAIHHRTHFYFRVSSPSYGCVTIHHHGAGRLFSWPGTGSRTKHHR